MECFKCLKKASLIDDETGNYELICQKTKKLMEFGCYKQLWSVPTREVFERYLEQSYKDCKEEVKEVEDKQSN